MLECFSVISDRYQWADDNSPDEYEAAIAALIAEAMTPYDAIPIGSILIYASVPSIPYTPDGYLLCDGSCVARETYPELAAVIAGVYGISPNPDNFVLPNFVSRFPMGGANGDMSIGTMGGASTITLATTNLPSHSHQTTTYSTSSPSGAVSGTGRYITAVNGSGSTGSAGSGTPVSIVPQHVKVHYIIRAYNA